MKRRQTSRPAAWVAVSLLIPGLAAFGSADTLRSTRGQPIVETRHLVRVKVVEGLATMKVQRSFKNRGRRVDQVQVQIALPANTVATGLRIKGGKQWYQGRLMEARMAAIVYESLTGFGPWPPKDPALLFWEEPRRLGLLVFPLHPGVESTIEYKLIQSLPYRDGLHYLKYPSLVAQTELAVPCMRVRNGRGSASISLNGEPVAAGSWVPLGRKLLSPEEFDDYEPPGGAEACDEWEWDDEGLDFCRARGESLITVAAPDQDVLDARYGLFSLGNGRWVARLEIDVARVMRPAPRKASVVFVVDGSRSWERDGIDAALSFCRAFAAHLPDAAFEVVMFRRRASRLFGEFVPRARFINAFGEGDGFGDRLAPGNGSHLERGLSLARSLIERRRGPRRIIVLTDALLRTAYWNSLSLRALSGFPQGDVVHFVRLEAGPAYGEVEADRCDGHDLAPVPLAHGGIFVELGAGENETDFRRAALDLVRPTKIDHFELLAADAPVEPVWQMEPPGALTEGTGFRGMVLTHEPHEYIKIQGRIWAEPFVRIVPRDREFSESVLPALVFADDLHEHLKDDEMLRAAAAGGAVSPVTSYLSIEPGTRPSVEGFEEGDSITRMGMGSIKGARGRGGNAAVDKGDDPDYRSILAKLAEEAARHCFEGREQPPIEARIECTFHEVVDLEVADGDNPARRTCIEDALWGISLRRGLFLRKRFEAELILNDGIP